jgi:enolase
MAHHSGDTEDDLIADLAVATCCNYIKASTGRRRETAVGRRCVANTP